MRKLIAASAMVIMAAGSGMAATWPAQAHAAHAHRRRRPDIEVAAR